VEEFKYLGNKLQKIKSSIQAEIKNRLKSRNACCHSVQNILSSTFLPKNIKLEISRTIILPFVLYGC